MGKQHNTPRSEEQHRLLETGGETNRRQVSTAQVENVQDVTGRPALQEPNNKRSSNEEWDQPGTSSQGASNADGGKLKPCTKKLKVEGEPQLQAASETSGSSNTASNQEASRPRIPDGEQGPNPGPEVLRISHTMIDETEGAEYIIDDDYIENDFINFSEAKF